MDAPAREDTRYYIVGVDKARFRKPVVPGDQLIVEVRGRKRSRGIWKLEGEARVEGRIVATAELLGALRGT